MLVQVPVLVLAQEEAEPAEDGPLAKFVKVYKAGNSKGPGNGKRTSVASADTAASPAKRKRTSQ